jgi:hypothetical protein
MQALPHPIFFFFKIGSCHVAQAGLERKTLQNLLPQSLEFWDFKGAMVLGIGNTLQWGLGVGNRKWTQLLVFILFSF